MPPEVRLWTLGYRYRALSEVRGSTSKLGSLTWKTLPANKDKKKRIKKKAKQLDLTLPIYLLSTEELSC